jgi:N-glycosylase/DNA lyase
LKTVFHTAGFSLSNTLNCGQCFRFREDDQGVFTGIVGDQKISLSQHGDDIEAVTFTEENPGWIEDYLGLREDYEKINSLLSSDSRLAEITSLCGNIRIMKQPFWETLESFIISQNNNIPRIQKIIEKFCGLFGKDMGGYNAFPLPEDISVLKEDDLAELHCGYRAPYLIDAAQKVASGEIDETSLREMPLDEARKSLMTIKGVGPKVADCTLLFGLYRLEAFPKDVWIKRAMAQLFPEGLPDCAAGYAGIAQQYIFHYARNEGMLEKD